MTVHVAQAKIKTENVPELRTAAARLFTAIDAAQPEGIRYAWVELDDGETFLAVAQVDDGVENPIPGAPRVPGAPAGPRGLAGRGADRPAADGRRLVPPVLSVPSMTLTQNPHHARRWLILGVSRSRS